MKKVLKTAVNILTWIILVFALLVTVVVFSSGRNNGVANLMGYIPLTVESNSMSPTFNMDDLIICHEVDDINQLKEGDVITFWTIIDGKRVKNTHRIIGINQAENSRSFVTRGDNNPIDDDMPAYAGDIIGKWTNIKLSGVGKIMSFLRTKTGFFVCILLPMALFFLFELYKFIVTLIEVKRGDAPEQLDEEEIKRRAIEEYLAQQNASGNTAKPAEEAAKTAETAAEEVKETAETVTEEVKENAETVTEEVKENAETVTEEVKENAETAAVEVTETAAEEVKDIVKDSVEA